MTAEKVRGPDAFRMRSDQAMVAVRLRKLMEAIRAGDQDAIAGEALDAAEELLRWHETLTAEQSEQKPEPPPRKQGRPKATA